MLNAPSDVQRAAALTAEFLSCIGALDAEFEYVYHVLKRHGVRENDLEDLVQEVFLVMWRRWGEFDRARPLRPWLAGISFRVAYNHRQRIGRELPGGLIDLADETPNPEESVASLRARVLVWRVLAGLPDKHRELILSHDVDGVPVREIAETLEVPVPTAHSRLRAARIAFAKAVRRLETVSATKAQIAPLLQAELLAEPTHPLPPVPPETKRRALSRARALLLMPWPRRPGEEAGASRATPASPAGAPSRPAARLGVGKVAALAAIAGVGAIAFVALRGRSAPPVADDQGDRPGFGPASQGALPGRRLETMAAMLPPVNRLGFAPPPPMTTQLTQGLVGYWRFDEGQNDRASNVAHDLSGHGNDCVLRRLEPGAAWTDGPLGGAIALDGQGWLECPRIDALAGLTNQLTIAMWVKRTGKLPGVRALVTRQLGHDELDMFHFGFRDDALWLRSQKIQGGPASGPFPAARGKWYHVAATLDAEGVAAVFVNGEQIRKKKKEGRPSLGGGANPLIIGAGVNGPDGNDAQERLEGVIDELVIYDRAIGETELHALASGVQPRVHE